MDERFLMEEMLEQMKKRNEIQERIECEMKLQNDLIAYYLENGKKVSNAIDDFDIYTQVERIRTRRRIK